MSDIVERLNVAIAMGHPHLVDHTCLQKLLKDSLSEIETLRAAVVMGADELMLRQKPSFREIKQGIKDGTSV